MTRPSLRHAAMLAAVFMTLSNLPAQGPLYPTQAPAPTMKSLQEIYDAVAANDAALDTLQSDVTDIENAVGALSGGGAGEARSLIADADLPLTISSPGSYVVTEDLTLSLQNTNGITIASDNVSIDLNGFRLSGPGQASGSSGAGIALDAARDNIRIANGSIVNWRGAGVDLSEARSFLAHDLRLATNGAEGFYGGDNGQLLRLAATDNSASGIRADNNCTLAHCAARENDGHGFQLGAGCSLSALAAEKNNAGGFLTADAPTVTDCVAYDNGDGNNDDHGFELGAHARIQHSVASANDGSGLALTGLNGQALGCNFSNNTRNGILALPGYARLEGNTCNQNARNGIEAEDGCAIIGNFCDSNGGAISDGSGIYINSDGQENRIEGNQLNNNDHGLFVNGTDNLIIANRAAGNLVSASPSADYRIVSGNDYGDLLTGSAGFAATNPYANLQY